MNYIKAVFLFGIILSVIIFTNFQSVYAQEYTLTEVKDAREDLQDIVNSYPQFNLKDKVVFDEEDNVTCIKKERDLV